MAGRDAAYRRSDRALVIAGIVAVVLGVLGLLLQPRAGDATTRMVMAHRFNERAQERMQEFRRGDGEVPRMGPVARIAPARLLLRTARATIRYLPSLALITLGVFLLIHERRHPLLPEPAPPEPSQSTPGMTP